MFETLREYASELKERIIDYGRDPSEKRLREVSEKARNESRLTPDQIKIGYVREDFIQAVEASRQRLEEERRVDSTNYI